MFTYSIARPQSKLDPMLVLMTMLCILSMTIPQQRVSIELPFTSSAPAEEAVRVVPAPQAVTLPAPSVVTDLPMVIPKPATVGQLAVREAVALIGLTGMAAQIKAPVQMVPIVLPDAGGEITEAEAMILIAEMERENRVNPWRFE